MVTREISNFFVTKRREVDVYTPSYLQMDLEKELEEYKSDDEPSCDAVPLAGKRSTSSS